jgi:hypothetical protein
LEIQDTTSNTQSVTVEVPEDRLAEFYGFFGRFLAAGSVGRGRGRRHHAGHHRGGRRCDRTGPAEREQGTAAGPSGSDAPAVV